jgi:hypothetical protein
MRIMTLGELLKKLQRIDYLQTNHSISMSEKAELEFLENEEIVIPDFPEVD